MVGNGSVLETGAWNLSGNWRVDLIAHAVFRNATFATRNCKSRFDAALPLRSHPRMPREEQGRSEGGAPMRRVPALAFYRYLRPYRLIF